MRYANNYDKSEQNTIKRNMQISVPITMPICRFSSSKMLQTLFTSIFPSSFCGHSFNFENKHTTGEDFVLLCSAIVVKAQCMDCERRESAEYRQQELRTNAIERHAKSVATPQSLSGRRDRPFFTKSIRVFLRSHGAPEN